MLYRQKYFYKDVTCFDYNIANLIFKKAQMNCGINIYGIIAGVGGTHTRTLIFLQIHFPQDDNDGFTSLLMPKL